MNVFALQELLKSEEIESDASYNGEKAIELVKERIQMVTQGKAVMYQLILLDYSMPGIGGVATATEICKLVSEHGVKKPYICCCTAYNSQNHRDIAISAGFDRYMIKPVSQEQIKEVIEISKE